jgi:histone acetyltransferase SAS3
MAATVPPTNDERGKLNPPVEAADSDLDAEGEEETDLYEMDQQLQDAVHRAYTGEADEDGPDEVTSGKNARHTLNGEDDGDNDEAEPVGAVKLPNQDAVSEEDYAESETADADGDPVFEENERDASEAESTDHESEAEDWEAESNGREDADVDIRSRANCL